MISKFSRRDFLALSAKGVGAAVLSYGLVGCGSDNDDTPVINVAFNHGVASGDPLATAVIVWTRVTPETDGQIKVSWQVATDANFSDVVNDGYTITGPERDYTVKIDAHGLTPSTTYYYRFMAGNSTSAVGKTKTLPQGNVDQVKFAVMSCANYPAGRFHVYDLVSQHTDLDAVLHLGDYIYEYARDGYASEDAQAMGREVQPAHECLALGDYRQRYAQYRGDASLQKLHAMVPFIVIWDDHEVANDTYKDGAENHNDGEGSFAARKAAALQAYFEWLPIRTAIGAREQYINRTFNFGNLVDLHMLDTRIIGRDKQLDYAEFMDPQTGEFNGTAFAAALADNSRTLLGAEQLTWLQSTLLAADAPWQVLGQQVLMGKMFLPAAIATQQLTIPQYAELGSIAKLAARAQAGDPTLTAQELAYLQANQAKLTPQVIALLQLPAIPYNLDAWDGYAYEREVLYATAAWRKHNLVVVAGDTHNAWASELVDRNGNKVGVEFATSSVSSPGLEYYLNLPSEQMPQIEQAIVGMVTDLQYCNMKDRGFLTLTFTETQVQSDWYYVDSVKTASYSELTARRYSAVTKRGEHTMSPVLPE